VTADQLSNRASAIKGTDQYDTNTLRNRATMTGAVIGGLGGVYYGYTRKKNVLVMGVAGVIVGAILSRLIMPKD
jgi:hypothetical protein